MSYDAADIQDGVDAIAPDHFPTCPRCGNLCGRLARICADCGCRLLPNEGDLAAIARQREGRATIRTRDDEKGAPDAAGVQGARPGGARGPA